MERHGAVWNICGDEILAKQYRGCGAGWLFVRDGVPEKILYARVAGVDDDDVVPGEHTALADGTVKISGMFSCWEFCEF